MRASDGRIRLSDILAVLRAFAAIALLFLPLDSHGGQTALAQRGSAAAGAGAPATARPAQIDAAVLDREVRADMDFLADDALHGRGSASRDEHVAALFAASQLQALGLAPGGDGGGYIQKIALTAPQQAAAKVRLRGFEDTPRTETWNAIGILRGSDPSDGAMVLSAHLDHLGTGPANAAGDTVYNGADDDASGTTAVLALAHIFAMGPRPRRTIVFALFGSEELGGLGNAGFIERPPVPLGSIVADLEFEMIGRPDLLIADPENTLWLTGYDRSDMGPELVQHGAKLVADPHPAERFFQRSDNYALARAGIVAQTISSFGLHKDYHQPTDDLGKIDFPHLESAIEGITGPLRWFANTDWKPQWKPGGRP